MVKFRSNSRALRYAVTLASLLVLVQLGAPAFGQKKLASFNYRINPGVIVGKAALTYAPLGKPYGIRYTINNIASGGGRMSFRMYSDGTLVWTQSINVTANGTFTKLEAPPKFSITKKNYGPFYLCVTSVAVGIVNVRPPCQTWHWVPMEVPISLVSKGCSGETGIKFLKKVETGWLDKQIITGLVLDFRDACNVLDAAYSGLTVSDPILKNVVNFALMDRSHVDQYFQFDMQMICMTTVNELNASAIKKSNAAASCNKWATRYFKAVRLVGFNFFDANPAKPGIQMSYVKPDPLLGLPIGVGRNNS
jgi:hypothetical protein